MDRHGRLQKRPLPSHHHNGSLSPKPAPTNANSNSNYNSNAGSGYSSWDYNSHSEGTRSVSASSEEDDDVDRSHHDCDDDSHSESHDSYESGSSMSSGSESRDLQESKTQNHQMQAQYETSTTETNTTADRGDGHADNHRGLSSSNQDQDSAHSSYDDEQDELSSAKNSQEKHIVSHSATSSQTYSSHKGETLSETMSMVRKHSDTSRVLPDFFSSKEAANANSSLGSQEASNYSSGSSSASRSNKFENRGGTLQNHAQHPRRPGAPPPAPRPHKGLRSKLHSASPAVVDDDNDHPFRSARKFSDSDRNNVDSVASGSLEGFSNPSTADEDHHQQQQQQQQQHRDTPQEEEEDDDEIVSSHDNYSASLHQHQHLNQDQHLHEHDHQQIGIKPISPTTELSARAEWNKKRLETSFHPADKRMSDFGRSIAAASSAVATHDVGSTLDGNIKDDMHPANAGKFRLNPYKREPRRSSSKLLSPPPTSFDAEFAALAEGAEDDEDLLRWEEKKRAMLRTINAGGGLQKEVSDLTLPACFDDPSVAGTTSTVPVEEETSKSEEHGGGSGSGAGRRHHHHHHHHLQRTMTALSEEVTPNPRESSDSIQVDDAAALSRVVSSTAQKEQDPQGSSSSGRTDLQEENSGTEAELERLQAATLNQESPSSSRSKTVKDSSVDETTLEEDKKSKLASSTPSQAGKRNTQMVKETIAGQNHTYQANSLPGSSDKHANHANNRRDSECDTKDFVMLSSTPPKNSSSWSKASGPRANSPSLYPDVRTAASSMSDHGSGISGTPHQNTTNPPANLHDKPPVSNRLSNDGNSDNPHTLTEEKLQSGYRLRGTPSTDRQPKGQSSAESDADRSSAASPPPSSYRSGGRNNRLPPSHDGDSSSRRPSYFATAWDQGDRQISKTKQGFEELSSIGGGSSVGGGEDRAHHNKAREERVMSIVYEANQMQVDLLQSGGTASNAMNLFKQFSFRTTGSEDDASSRFSAGGGADVQHGSKSAGEFSDVGDSLPDTSNRDLSSKEYPASPTHEELLQDLVPTGKAVIGAQSGAGRAEESSNLEGADVAAGGAATMLPSRKEHKNHNNGLFPFEKDSTTVGDQSQDLSKNENSQPRLRADASSNAASQQEDGSVASEESQETKSSSSSEISAKLENEDAEVSGRELDRQVPDEENLEQPLACSTPHKQVPRNEPQPEISAQAQRLGRGSTLDDEKSSLVRNQEGDGHGENDGDHDNDDDTVSETSEARARRESFFSEETDEMASKYRRSSAFTQDTFDVEDGRRDSVFTTDTFNTAEQVDERTMDKKQREFFKVSNHTKESSKGDPKDAVKPSHRGSATAREVLLGVSDNQSEGGSTCNRSKRSAALSAASEKARWWMTYGVLRFKWFIIAFVMLIIVIIAIAVPLSKKNKTGADGVNAPQFESRGDSDAVNARDSSFTSSSVFRNKEWKQMGQDITLETPIGISSRSNAPPSQMGFAVALSKTGRRLAVGSRYDSPAEVGSKAGSVRLYEYTNESWIMIGVIYGESPGDQFGFSVSLSDDGSLVAAGALGSDGNGDRSGQVRVYAYNFRDKEWRQHGDSLYGSNDMDLFGMSVSLSSSGHRVAVGAPYHDAFGLANTGRVVVYQYDSSRARWIPMPGSERTGNNEKNYMGWSVSLSGVGNHLAVGSPNHEGIGYVQILRWVDASSQWEFSHEFRAARELIDFGFRVGMSEEGDVVAISAPNAKDEGNNALPNGHVSIYEGDSERDRMNGVAGDFSGFALSLSDDGKRVVIGSPQNDDFGVNNGKVQMYQYNGQGWDAGMAVFGTEERGDAGLAVSLSGDGTRFAVGTPFKSCEVAPCNDGYVRVFA